MGDGVRRFRNNFSPTGEVLRISDSKRHCPSDFEISSFQPLTRWIAGQLHFDEAGSFEYGNLCG